MIVRVSCIAKPNFGAPPSGGNGTTTSALATQVLGELLGVKLLEENMLVTGGGMLGDVWRAGDTLRTGGMLRTGKTLRPGDVMRAGADLRTGEVLRTVWILRTGEVLRTGVKLRDKLRTGVMLPKFTLGVGACNTT